MAVISVTITESAIQVLSGIPQTISLATNVPASIFYTLDGSDPTVSSLIYISPITLPTNFPSVSFKVFATDGSIVSAITSKVYSPNQAGTRKPHDTVIGLPFSGVNTPQDFPYSDEGPILPEPYGRSGGITVDDPSLPSIPDGYDGAGGIAGGTDLPWNQYTRIFSETNSLGETGPGIGTLPARVTIKVPVPTSPSTSSDMSSKFFNPKAMVMYQDSRNPPYDNVPQLNRASFSLSNPETEKNGSILMNTAFDSSSVSGSFLRSHYNPRDNTITYYYRDADTNQWIISTEVYSPRDPNLGALYQVVFSSRQNGIGLVYKWLPFASRKLI